MTQKLHQDLVFLKELVKKNLHNHLMGICRHMDNKSVAELNSLFPKWNKFSGFLEYPVPSIKITAPEAYYKFNLWNKRTKYGKSRHELLDWLIEETKTETK